MKNTMVSAVGLLLLVLLTPACEWFKKKPAAEATAQEATVEPKIRLIDVNTEEVYKDAHIPGAVNVAVDRIEEVAKDWNKKTPVVVYCSDYNCQASHAAAQKLTTLGFEDVSIFAGGIHEWNKQAKANAAAYPVEGEAKLPFLDKEVAVQAREGERTISAEDLSKRLEEAKK